ncbi:MAG TPA: glycosyltransferase, partial [Chloroflexota bacterium]
APPNVQITGFLSQPDLDALLDDASVYVQASAHEGFGCALAEAMARGCIPVVSRQGALPEVVGEYGVFVDPADVSSVATGIRRALAQGSDLRPAIAERIATCFSFERRRHDLLALVKKIGRANGM